MATRGILTYSEMMCPIILNRDHEIAKCPTVPQAELLILNKCLLTLESLQLLKSLQNFRVGIEVGTWDHGRVHMMFTNNC